MSKFETLLESFNAGDKTAIRKMENLHRICIKERDFFIIRNLYGIGTLPRNEMEIAEEMGMEIQDLKTRHKKTLNKIENILEKVPYLEYLDVMIDNPNIETRLKYLPVFADLKKERKFSGPLAKYATYTLEDFIIEYTNPQKQLRGKEVYDKLIEGLAPEILRNEKSDAEKSTLNTIFPSTFDETEPLGKMYKQMVSELVSYLQATSHIRKNKTRAEISDAFFNQYLTPKEIKDKYNISTATIIDNFLSPLFCDGIVSELTLNPSFFEAVNNYFKTVYYCPLQKVKDELMLDDKDIRGFLWLFGADVFEKKEYHQEPIVIHKGDLGRVNECITRCFEVLNNEIIPITKQSLITKIEDRVGSDKWLPEYVEVVLSTNDSVLQDADGLVYLSDNMLKGITSRVCRIIYNSSQKTATRKEILSEYQKLYKELPSAFRCNEMSEKGFFNISDGVFKYSSDKKKPLNVHDYIDDYISKKVLFKWSDLLEEIKKINPSLKERSERAYILTRCSTCSTDSDILVLKGHENDFPQYQWKAKIKMDKTNYLINQAVEILKKQPGYEMIYKDFVSELNQIIRKNGYSDHTTGTVISKYTTVDPKLFIKDSANIRLDLNVLANVSLTYIGLGYKYSDFYQSIYALTISELKSKPDHKMLRSELTTLASTQISDEIDGRIVNKAFTDRAMPQMLFVEGSGRNAYICLDMAKLASDVAKDKQYKVSTDDSNSQTDATPTMIVDTAPRQDSSYRQLFNWHDIKIMLKKDLKHYDKPFFYQGISSDDVVEKFELFMSKSQNAYLNTLIPQAYYELSYANVDRWSSYDYRSKIARAFESLLMDIYYQNRGVESQTKGLFEIMDLAFPDYLKARKNFDWTGFNGILNNIYNDRINFAHPTTSELPTLLDNIKAFISYLALYVYTVDKYYHPI